MMTRNGFTEEEVRRNITGAAHALSAAKGELAWREKYDTGEGSESRMRKAKQLIFECERTVETWKAELATVERHLEDR